MEELVKEKEKELERVEEQGCALVQNKTDEACAIVMETLQGVNHTWANLDHLVSSPVVFHSMFLMWYFGFTHLSLLTELTECHCVLFIPPSKDRATKHQPEVSAGSVEPIQAGFRRDQWLPDGGKVLCISFPPPHGLPRGCAAAGAKSAGMLG